VAYSTFDSNTAARGGAIYTGIAVIVKFRMTSFTNNRAMAAGGAISTAPETMLELFHSHFESNAFSFSRPPYPERRAD
jgi:predicted outer membrane repeat protein